MNDYTTVSLPKPLLKEINRLIKRIGFWPSTTAFVREACITKLHVELVRQRIVNEEAIKLILGLPKCESADETPDIILGFKEQLYLKKILEAEAP